MRNRALFVFDWHHTYKDRLLFVQEQAAGYDELIFLLPDADQLPAEGEPFCGQLMVQLHQLFTQQLNKPFYLLPMPAKGAPPIQQAVRWRIICPAFTQVFIDKPGVAAQLQTILQAPVQHQQFEENYDSLLPASLVSPVRRGLFITRAQPFHNGHAAFIQQMAEEMEELIVVIAMANRSHQLTDIATAGERLSMVGPELNRLAPSRHYLAALPYNDYGMENLYELEYLLPPFQHIYTSNPSVAAMAITAGYEVKGLQQQLPVSSTLVRTAMLNDQPYKSDVPAGIYRFLQESDIAQRLQIIVGKENR